jgi:fructokinase
VSNSVTPHIVGIGELLWDILPSGPRLGGAVANLSVLCARLGDNAALITSIGNDGYGNAAIQQLTQPDLDLHLIQTDPTHPTGTVEVSFNNGQPSYTISHGVAWDFIQTTPEIIEAAQTADAICFGTLSQRHEVSRATIRSFVTAPPPACIRVCDVNLRKPHYSAEILDWSLSHATIIKISDEELQQVFSLLGKPEASLEPQDAANLLLNLFPECQLIAMTLGPKGCLLTTRNEVAAHPGFPIQVVDTVGAGDAFTAGLIFAYLRGAPLPVVAMIGNLCGSFVASESGATPPLTVELIGKIDVLLQPYAET